MSLPYRPEQRSVLGVPLGDLIWCALWLVLSRLALEAVGVTAREAFAGKLAFDYVWVYADRTWLDIWGVWDTGWYLDIVWNGYDAQPKAEGPIAGQANWAFFPGYPMLAWALSQVTGLAPFPVMVALSNLCFAAALPLLWRETAALFGPAAARGAVALICVVPASYVFSSAYTESLFLLLILAAMSAARGGWWLSAGLLAAGAALTRNMGVLLTVPMLILALQEIGRERLIEMRVAGPAAWMAEARTRWRRIAALALPVLALLGFMIFLFVRTGNPLAFVAIQEAWGRQVGFPFTALLRPFLGEPTLTATGAITWVFAVVALALTAFLALRRAWAPAALAALLLLVPLSAGLVSVMRYIVVVYPVFVLAGLLVGGHRVPLSIAVAVLALLNGFFMACWALGLPNVI